MKTAYDLLKEQTKDFSTTLGFNNTVKYAEDFAQQQSCEFAEYVEQEYTQFKEVGTWINVADPKIPQDKKFTTNELYQQWKGEQDNG